MKIFDCVIYNGEDHLLDVRFNVLENIDYFVIVESNISFSGIKKEYRFNLNNFSKFKDKIRYVQIGDEKSNYKNKSYYSFFKHEKWQRELGMRDAILQGLYDCDPNDLIIISDVDELPNLSSVDKHHQLFLFSQICCQYKFNLKNPGLTPFHGSKAIQYQYLGLPSELKLHDQPHLGINNYNNLKTKKIKNGGFHFSYCMSVEAIIEKLSFYSHNERNINYNKQKLQKFIDNKIDIWNGKFNYAVASSKLVELPLTILPKYIQNNKKKFKDFLLEI